MDKDSKKQAEIKDDKVEPIFVCGVVVRLIPNGQGINVEPITAPDCSRTATVDDMIMIINQAKLNFDANLAAGRSAKYTQQLIDNASNQMIQAIMNMLNPGMKGSLN